MRTAGVLRLFGGDEPHAVESRVEQAFQRQLPKRTQAAVVRRAVSGSRPKDLPELPIAAGGGGFRCWHRAGFLVGDALVASDDGLA